MNSLSPMMAVSKVLLINVGKDDDIATITTDGAFPALGVLSLGTVLKHHLPNVEVVVIDGQFTPIVEIEYVIKDFRPNLVGFSVLNSSYQSAIRLSVAAKDVGAITVFGNDHASVLGRQILARRDTVDFICAADIGEFSLLALVDHLNGKCGVESVPQLMYRVNDRIEFNDLPEVPNSPNGRDTRYLLDKIPIADRTLLPPRNWEFYLANYLGRFARFHQGENVTGVSSINRARGCARVKRPCTFCGIKDLSFRFSSGEMFWSDVRQAQADVGATVFFEAFDSFSSAPRWVKEVSECKPKDIESARFFVYTQATETNRRLVQLYEHIGVCRVNMGLESGDTRMLRRLKGPHDSIEQNRMACEIFKEAGIPIYASFVLGGPGETYESLENTMSFMRWLIDNDMLASLEAQPLYPDLGALTGAWLLHPDVAMAAGETLGFQIRNVNLLRQMSEKYGNTDLIDFDKISYDWNQIFSHVQWDELLAATAEITDYARNHDTLAGSAFTSSSLVEDAKGKWKQEDTVAT